MKRIIIVFGIAALLSGVLAFSRSRLHKVRLPISSGYTMRMQVVDNGKLTANVRRYVKSNGDFLEETDHLNPDGTLVNTTKLIGTDAQGGMFIDDAEQKLRTVGRAGLIRAITDEEIKSLKDYVREDTLLGYRVLVSKHCDSSGDNEAKRCTEYWVAPDLGSDDVKVDFETSGHHVTKTAITITKGEPSFAEPANYGVAPASHQANPWKPKS